MNANVFNPEIYLKSLPLVRSYVINNSGNLHDVEDVLQEGLFVYFKNLNDPNFKLTVAPESYILGVCKIVWLNELKKRKKDITNSEIKIDPADRGSDDLDCKMRKEGLLKVIERNLKKLSVKCQQVFQFRKEGLTCDQIAERMNWKSRQISKDKMYRCKRRLLEIISDDQEYIQLFCKD